mgnify:CR=1 FL=1
MFQFKVKFPESDANDFVYDSKLEYVNIFTNEYLPSFYFDDETAKFTSIKISSYAMDIFIRRYNNHELKRGFKINDFITDSEIKSSLKYFNLDLEKFCYLFLFIYDFTYAACNNKLEIKNSPLEDLNQLSELIAENINSIDGWKNPSCKEEMSLTLRIGKEKMIIDNNKTLFLLAALSQSFKTQNEENPFYNGSNVIVKGEEGYSIKEYKKNKTAYYFAKLMGAFLKTQPIERKDGADLSYQEKDFICRLLYITNLVDNDSILGYNEKEPNDLNYYKGFMHQYKDIKLSDITAPNNFYFQ